jgi:hypothetical protein
MENKRKASMDEAKKWREAKIQKEKQEALNKAKEKSKIRRNALEIFNVTSEWDLNLIGRLEYDICLANMGYYDDYQKTPQLEIHDTTGKTTVCSVHSITCDYGILESETRTSKYIIPIENIHSYTVRYGLK